MSREPLDREITKALRESTDTASPGFTAGVLNRLDERPQRGLFPSRPVLAIATTLVLFVLGVTIGLRFDDRGATQPAVTQREELIREVLALQQELDEVRTLADQATPVLYLGGNETLDLMYDLRDYDDLIAAGEYRPASLQPDRG